jgi:hypothetical protein
MTQYEFFTTLNGAPITVYLKVLTETDEGGTHTELGLESVFFDGTDITPVLSKETQIELEMEAELGFWESAWESLNGY